MQAFSDKFLLTAGGLAITAVGLARLEIKPELISVIGDDFFGDYIFNKLQSEGINLKNIEKVKNYAESEFNILDSLPGTACSAVETIMGSDLVVLITDPTPFGVNDLNLSSNLHKIYHPVDKLLNDDFQDSPVSAVALHFLTRFHSMNR